MTEQAARDGQVAEGYRRWWAPVLIHDAVATLDLVAGDVAAGARRILDVGTGTGTLGLAAVERWPGVVVTGIDASPEMVGLALREADARLGAADRPRFDAVVAGADHLPFDAATFDLAVSSFVLQLVPSRARALREVRRVLRPGGRLAYVTWLADDRPFAGDRVFDAVLDELGLGGDFGDGADTDDGAVSGDLASPRAAADGLRRTGFVRARAETGILEHRFDPESYVGFLAEFDEEDLFAGLVERRRSELVGRLRQRLAELPPDDLVLRLPIVRATGLVPGR